METPPGPRQDPTPADRAAWSQLKELVADALELPAAERDALLTARCEGPGQRRQVEAMLAAAAAAADFLQAPALAASGIGVAPLAAGTVCGPYVVEALIGEGGFSDVYRARQEQPFPRRVALKVLKPGMDSRAVLARFALERRTLARLEHPGIARILDAGATATGRPFVAMEFVDGATLARHLAEHAPPLRQRLQLFLQICEAVAHAHQRGVIHRDLKPGNLMVTTLGDAPQAKVIDFGIAKVLEGDGVDRTRTGQLLGTPAYCSPEQQSGDVDDVDTRTDVFALGIVLAELVTGRRPAATAGPGDGPRELQWIVGKATDRQRERRYAGVAELAGDVRAYLAGDALLAGPPTRRYRLATFARRHRAALLATALVALAWLGGGIAAAVGFWRADEARREAEDARAEADATADYLARLIGEVKPGRAGRDVKVVELLHASDGLLQRAAAVPDVAARLHHVVGNAYEALGEFAAAETHLRAAAEGRRARHGDLDWRGIEAASDLVGMLARAGRPEAVEPLLADVARRAVLARGPDHPRARVLTDLRAKLAFDRGRPAEAEAPLRELLAMAEASGSPSELITVLGNLAQVLLSRRAIDEARSLARRGHELARQQFGEDAPATLAAARKLAAVDVAAADHATVAKLLEPLLPLARRRFGEDHPETLGIANYLAYALQSQGQLDAAEAAYRPLVAAQQRKLGRLHAQAMMTLLNFGKLLEAKGDFAGAEPVLRDAGERFREARGADDADTVRAAFHLANVVAAQGRHQTIAVDFAAAVARIERLLGPDHATTRTARAAWLVHLVALAGQQQAAAAADAAATWTRAFDTARALGDERVRRQAAEALAALSRAAGDERAAARWSEAAR